MGTCKHLPTIPGHMTVYGPKPHAAMLQYCCAYMPPPTFRTHGPIRGQSLGAIDRQQSSTYVSAMMQACQRLLGRAPLSHTRLHGSSWQSWSQLRCLLPRSLRLPR